MSTRSNICFETKAGPTSVIYCHSDGYPSYTGRILLECYNTARLAKKLVSLGDASYIDKKLVPKKGKEHSFDGERQEEVCLFYHRDRQEPWNDVKPRRYSFWRSASMACDNDYTYVFKESEGKWYFRKCREPLCLLTEDDCKED